MVDMDKKEQILHDHRIIRKTNFGKSGNLHKMTNVSLKDKQHADLMDCVLNSSLFTSLLAECQCNSGRHQESKRPGDYLFCLIPFFYIKPQQINQRTNSMLYCLIPFFYIKPQPPLAACNPSPRKGYDTDRSRMRPFPKEPEDLWTIGHWPLGTK